MATAIGSTTTNSSRHEPRPSTTPDTAGPSAGATDIARVTLPITRPRSCWGTTVISVVISRGIITAVPQAWTTRAASRTSNVGATAASVVPARKTPIAVAKAARVVTRCRNQPVTGMTAAMVSMNAVDSHCAARAETSRSTISRGMALIMIVSLRITTKVASTSQRITGGVVGRSSARVGAEAADAGGAGFSSGAGRVVVTLV